MGGAVRHARHLLSAAVRALGSRTERAGPGGADRFAGATLLFLLHRDLAAGSLLPHRAAHCRGHGLVPDERRRRPGVVRISVPANRMDRSFPRHRAVDRRRPPRASAARSPAMVARSAGALRLEAFFVADGGVVDRRRLGALFRRRAEPGQGPCDISGAACGLRLHRHAHVHDLRARRLDARASVRLYVSMAAHPGGFDRRVCAQRHLSVRSRRTARFAEEGRDAARAWSAGRRLHRLPAMRACLSDRRRYPRRPQSRLHPMRPVHRCLRRGDGQNRPAGAPDRLRHRRQHQAAFAGAATVLPDPAQPHRALRRHHRAGRRGDAVYADDAAA